jgi:hypothetical protein
LGVSKRHHFKKAKVAVTGNHGRTATGRNSFPLTSFVKKSEKQRNYADCRFATEETFQMLLG